MTTLKISADGRSQEIQKGLELWFQSALGRALLASQRPVIEQKIHRLFGVYQLEIGVSHRIPVGNPSNLGYKFNLLPQWESDLPDNTVISSPDEIAIDHDVVDLVILHHTLDFATDPHQTLRDSFRVLKSSGYLLIVGFNPIGFWGLRKRVFREANAPWNNRFISGKRIEDWLNLLDFKVGGLDYHFFAPPVTSQGVINRFTWLDSILNSRVPLGAYYTILAQKQVESRISVAPKWRKKANVVGFPLANRTRSN